MELYESHEPIDVVTVTAQLKKTDRSRMRVDLPR